MVLKYILQFKEWSDIIFFMKNHIQGRKTRATPTNDKMPWMWFFIILMKLYVASLEMSSGQYTRHL